MMVTTIPRSWYGVVTNTDSSDYIWCSEKAGKFKVLTKPEGGG